MKIPKQISTPQTGTIPRLEDRKSIPSSLPSKQEKQNDYGFIVLGEYATEQECLKYIAQIRSVIEKLDMPVHYFIHSGATLLNLELISGEENYPALSAFASIFRKLGAFVIEEDLLRIVRIIGLESYRPEVREYFLRKKVSH